MEELMNYKSTPSTDASQFAQDCPDFKPESPASWETRQSWENQDSYPLQLLS